MKITGRPPKLTANDVVMLRSLYKAGHGKTALARRFGIAGKTVVAYLKGRHKNRDLAAVSPYPL